MFNKNKKLYEITLYPYRSMNKLGFFILMFTLALISFVAGIMFILIGAWPVFGFFGLDVLLVYICFKLNFRSGKDFEIIDLTKKELIIRKYGATKLRKMYKLNPNWIKIKILNPKSHLSKLKITSKKKSVIIGSFLRPEERLEIVETLKKALTKHNFHYVE